MRAVARPRAGAVPVARAAAALILLALLAVAATTPAQAGERRVPPRFFGVMWDKHIQNAPTDVQEQQWAQMKRSGVESARVIFGWHLAQSSRSVKPNFVRTDQMVRNASLRGIDVLPVVMYAPPWARVFPDVLGSAPKYPRLYARYVSELVRRYGSRGYFWRRNPDVPRRPIRYWQIWNEPALPYQLAPHRGWQKRYAEMLRLSYRAVKKQDPRSKVVLAGMVNDAWNTIRSLHQNGRVRGYYDVAALHMYSGDTNDYVEILRRFRVAVNKLGGRRKPIFITEIGASASRNVFRAPNQEYLQVTDEGLAALIPRAYRVLNRVRRERRLTRVYWYTWASPYIPSDGIFGFAGLNAYNFEDVEPRPAVAAFRRTARAYQGR